MKENNIFVSFQESENRNHIYGDFIKWSTKNANFIAEKQMTTKIFKEIFFMNLCYISLLFNIPMVILLLAKTL